MTGRRQTAFLRTSRPGFSPEGVGFRALDFALDIIVPSGHPVTVEVLYRVDFSRAKRGFLSLESAMRRGL
jgi:hypothetical protein